MRVGLLLAWVTLPFVACEQRGVDIGKDPAHAPSSDPRAPFPSSSASPSPSPSFSGRDPFKPPGDAGAE